MSTYSPDITELFEEAFDRCGIEMRTGREFSSARRSLDIMLAEWSNRGLNRWTIETIAVPTLVGENDYELGPSVVDALSVVVRRDGTDYELERLSRSEWLNIPVKSQQGRPSQFYVDRQDDPVLRVWLAPDREDTLFADVLTRIPTPSTSTSVPSIPFRFYAALAAGLAYYLSVKYAPDRTQMLKAAYEEEFGRAAMEDRDRASLKVEPFIGHI